MCNCKGYNFVIYELVPSIAVKIYVMCIMRIDIVHADSINDEILSTSTSSSSGKMD